MLKPRTILTRAAIGAATCLALLPGAASAAGTVFKDGTELRWVGTADADQAFVSYDSGAAQIVFFSPAVNFTIGSSGCTKPDADRVRCPVAGVTTIKLVGNAGNDSMQVSLHSGVNKAIVMEGGDGEDFLYAGASGHNGGATLTGGAGADNIYGTNGVDTIDGGDGGDFMLGFAGADSFTGGADFDLVAYYDRPDTQPVTVTIDGAANDGSTDEKDNVQTDVEDVIGTGGNDSLTGSAGPNSLDGSGGNDIIDGAGGFDSFLGGQGNDSILARDGRSERIDCGEGTDNAITDTSDTQSACETNNASDELESDVDKDGVSKPADCNDKDPSIRPGAVDTPNNGVDEDCSGADTTKTDLDGDGFSPPQDCNDASAEQSPGKPEIYGNKVDEDCNGKLDPLVSFTSRVLASFRNRGGLQLTSFSILNPPRGANITINCSGGKKKGCPFATNSQVVPDGSRQLQLLSKMKKAKLKAGAVLEVRILRKDAIGKVSQFKIPRGTKKLPKETKLCMGPTDAKPRKC